MIGLEFTGERKKQPGVMTVGKGDCKFHCIKQIDNIFLCVCTVLDHRRRHSM